MPEWPIGTALKAVAGRDVSRGFESRPLCRIRSSARCGELHQHLALLDDVAEVRQGLKRLLVDIDHHVQRQHDLAYDEVEQEIGGSE